MKVLKNNFNKEAYVTFQYPKKMVCEKCSSELEYVKSDIEMGEHGINYVVCPLCEHSNMLDEDVLQLTINNIEFPTHFRHTSKENGAVDTCNNEIIKRWIKEGIEYLKENYDEDYWLRATGNLYLIVFNNEGDGEWCIFVSDSHYETEIPM